MTTPVDIHDVAVIANAAPATAAAGDLVTVDVTVANIGSYPEQLTVTLTDDLDGVIGTDLVDLLAGEVAVVSFGWDTTLSARGDHLLVADATITTGDESPADNTLATTVTLLDPTHDVAVTAIDAPASAIAGDLVTIQVTVTNEGTFDETFDVTLTGATLIDGSTVALAAGASSVETYAGDTTGVALADHILVAEASAIADVTLTIPKGKIYSGSGATTDAAGNAVYTYTVNSKKDGKGTYVIDATVSGDGYVPGTDQTTFEVTK